MVFFGFMVVFTTNRNTLLKLASLQSSYLGSIRMEGNLEKNPLSWVTDNNSLHSLNTCMMKLFFSNVMFHLHYWRNALYILLKY